jgi:hypothetical protein
LEEESFLSSRRSCCAALVASALTACGSTESWLDGVYPLSPSPTCYQSPPALEVPLGTSAEVVRSTEIATVSRDAWSAVCIGRYKTIFELMRANQDTAVWQYDDKAGGSRIEVRLIDAPDERTSSGRFVIELVRTGASADPCMGGSTDVYAEGSFSPERATIDQGEFKVYWNQTAVIITRPAFAGTASSDVLYLHRGCDPKTATSFANLIDYAPGQADSCWRRGAFVSCDGVDTSWPY